MNHQCDGNSYIDTIERSFKANRSINKGEEITFNYNSTEWKMSDPFECWCCNKAIKGFAFLSDLEIKKMEQLTIAPFLFDLKKALTLQV